MPPLEHAVQTFIQGYSSVRSLTYPYLPTQISGVTILRDTPDRAVCRMAEVVSCGNTPEQAVEAARRYAPNRHFLCDIVPPESDIDATKSAYKSLGYRILVTEKVFVHELKNLPILSHTEHIKIFNSTESMEGVPVRRKGVTKFGESWTRIGLFDNGVDVGWVALVPTAAGSWVSDLYVVPEHRRKGHGHALMSALLHEVQAQNLGPSVLTASKVGALLYPRLGYTCVGKLIATRPTMSM